MKKTIIILFSALLLIPLFVVFGDFTITDLQSDILLKMVWVYLGVAGACFAISQLVRNYSQVDKLWSIIPVVFAWMMAVMGGLSPKLLLMAGLVTLWGARLTYNFHRRGGYSWRFWEGEEDYRWEILMQNPLFSSPISWSVFNLFFISLYQLGLLLLITLPMLLVVGLPDSSLGIQDWLLAALFIGLLILETVADQQQWEFQTEKHRLIRAGETLTPPYSKGFATSGLWGVSRHPNYFAEQSIWVVFYLFGAMTTGSILNWTIVGGVLLILLFQGSVQFSEGISAEKYPAYKDYQNSIPKFIPNVFNVLRSRKGQTGPA